MKTILINTAVALFSITSAICGETSHITEPKEKDGKLKFYEVKESYIHIPEQVLPIPPSSPLSRIIEDALITGNEAILTSGITETTEEKIIREDNLIIESTINTEALPLDMSLLN